MRCVPLWIFSAAVQCCLCQYFYLPNENKDVERQWNEFKERFNKTYTDYHDVYKKEAWLANLKKIKKHNEEAAKGLHTYFLLDHNLADLTPQSYLQKMVKLTKSRHRKVEAETVGDFYHKYNHVPEEVNWIDKGFVTPTYNQKDCGSCYAFSIAGVLQGQIFKQTNKLVPLSSQQIVDCSAASGNFGCGGGSLRNTLRYLENTGGLMAYSDYPYVAKQRRCQFDKHMAIANITSWAVLPARDEKALEAAVAKIGPIAVSINAAPHTFQLYQGIYDDPVCTSNTVNHAMLIVGYTKDAWILKNWWGKHWGEQGYMRLKRHKNRCGVANYAAYAMV
ncbi:procathepsin L isoform X2 [Cylas formicarius]|uniref:procathepsin L isoform X2 n=1 Tax=Cylas formicarius TaxID=197179 RepID=UPI0029584EFD|nr:procathepsin L isoform X2 [Cylas formicarius]